MADDPQALQSSVMLAATVHDIRNRMFQLQAQLHGLLQGRGHDIELCDSLSGIEQRFGALSAELGMLLQRIRLSDAPVQVCADQHAVAQFLHDALAAMPEPSIQVQVQVEPAGLSGWFDASLMAQVVRDAMDNACRYARHQARIRARAERGGLLLLVEDDGEGFGASHDPLAQTGLGLHIAQRVVAAHTNGHTNGELHCDRSPDLGGARLQIWLP